MNTKIFWILAVALFCIPSGVSAGYASIFSSSGNGASGGGEVIFNNYPTNSIQIYVGAGAGGGSQQGGGRGYNGRAEVAIGTSSVVDDQPVASDGGSVSASNSITITKDAGGNWMDGAINMGTSVWISGSAFFDGENCVCSGGTNGDINWVDATVGNISIYSNIPGISFTLTGPATITGTTDAAGNASFANRPTGTYTITWGAVSGYATPSSSSFTLTSGSTRYANSYYIPTGMCRTGDVQQCGDWGVPPCEFAGTYPVNNGGPEGIIAIQSTSDVCACSGGNVEYLPDYNEVPLCAPPTPTINVSF